MIMTRRALLVGAGATAAAFGLANAVAEKSTRHPAGLAPQEADALLLISGGADGEALRRQLGPRSGRTIVMPVAPLGRGGFGDLAAIIERASDVHVIAAGDVADLLVIDTLLQRAGHAVRHKTSAIGDLLVARF